MREIQVGSTVPQFIVGLGKLHHRLLDSGNICKIIIFQ